MSLLSTGRKCFLCKEAGRDQAAHRLDSRGPVCQWHFSGEPHPEEAAARRDEEKLHDGRVKFQVKEKPMSEKQCKQCGKKVNANNRSGVCTNCQRKGVSPKANPGKAHGAHGAAGVITISATPELLDSIWASLAAEKKAALINKLPEV